MIGLAAMAAFYLLFFVVPIGVFLRVSFLTNLGFAQLGAPTVQNYLSVFTDPYFREEFAKTFQLSGVTAIFSVALAFPVAFKLARSRAAWSSLLFFLVIAALFTNYIVATLGLVILLGDEGPINNSLIQVGLIHNPIHLSNNFGAVAAGQIIGLIPLGVLALMPACDAVPKSLADAAYGLGATRWRTFWYVIFPETRLPLIAITLLVFSISTGFYITPALLGGGHVRVVPMEIREQTLDLLNYPMAATLSVLLITIVLTIVGVALLVARPRGYFRAAG